MFTKKLLTILTSLALGIFLVLPAQAQEPYEQPDDTWISINGTVEAVSPTAFELNYGEGLITVEMDDWDMTPEGFQVIEGDKVQVFGAIDDDFFETTTIEASSVFVESRGTYYYSSSADEEDTFITIATPLAPSMTTFQGTVTSVGLEEFTLDAEETMLTVEVDEMPYDPLDDEGFQKVEVGDFVSVTGEFQPDIFEGREFDAKAVTILVDAKASDYSMAK